jgi:hypothetical protein
MIGRFRPSVSWLWLFVLVFQVSVLPDSLLPQGAGRVANAFVLLALLAMVLIAGTKKIPKKIAWFVVLPLSLVLGGYSVNILRNLSRETLGYIGMSLPWLAALSIPFMKSYSLQDSWKLFYRFTLVFAVVACVEYYAVFSGILATTPINNTRGEFEVGFFTIFLRLADGTPYDRMFGVFPEPGTLGMLHLPAIAYALVFGQWWALVPLLGCMYLSRSLGGWASLVIMAAMFVYWRVRSFAGRAVLLSLLVAGVSYFFLGYFVTTYQQKDASATVREENVLVFIRNLPDTLVRYPLGAPLAGRSLSALQETDQKYLGSNFAPYTALILGGIPAFVGYCAIFLVALFASAKYFVQRRDSNKLLACAFLSLPAMLLFVFQRATIFDTPVFAFLFAAPVMTVMLRRRRRGREGVRQRRSKSGRPTDGGPTRLLPNDSAAPSGGGQE